jgi:hypothetical protein
MKTPQIFTTGTPYAIKAEEVWDYYKEPPNRKILYSAESYLEALKYVYNWYDECKLADLQHPWTTSLWIDPEPPGLHFDYNTYIEYLILKKS